MEHANSLGPIAVAPNDDGPLDEEERTCPT
jgi:hypothetical protein